MSELPVVRQDESGAMTSECLDELRGAMLEAAAAEDFRTAAQYKTMVDVLGPREPRPLSDFSSEDPDVAANRTRVGRAPLADSVAFKAAL